METYTNQSGSLFLSIEDEVYLSYLKSCFSNTKFSYQEINFRDIYKRISELKKSIFILQSDSSEIELLDISRKIKRIYGYETRIIFLSSDYEMEEDAINVTDKFFTMPVEFSEIEKTLKRFLDNTHKILIIDDSKLVHSHLVPPLSNAGYVVLEAFDGKEGLEMARSNKPELIICDIEMPIMNGFEVCSAIRNEPSISDTYIIMSSTLGSQSDIQKGFHSGVDEYITKPVVIGELLERINRHFRQSLSGREYILLIEPDEKISSNVSKSLRKQGFSVRTTISIQNAIKLCKKFNFDLIITEMDSEDGTALDLSGYLKSLNIESRPDVIVVTSRESEADFKMITNMGLSGVISKPFSMDTLLASTERILADKRTKQEKKELLKYLSRSSIQIASEKANLGKNGQTGARVEKKFASILFMDMVNFTSRCEKYDPSSVVEQVNNVFDMATKKIHEWKGDVDKFMGDACLSYWLLDTNENNAKNMLQSYFEIKDELYKLNSFTEILKLDPIKLRYGMNSGEVILADIGSPDARIDLTIIGDHVNLAARLESANKHYGSDNLITEYTKKLIGDSFLVREIDSIKVYGKDIAVTTFEVLDYTKKATDTDKKLVELFQKGRELYKRRMFKEAEIYFIKSYSLEKNTLLKQNSPSLVFVKRCRLLQKNLPKNWDGIWTLGK